jgi:hypothetical protein
MAEDTKTEEAAKSLKEFFEAVPPGRTVPVANLAQRQVNERGSVSYPMVLPILELHCTTDSCNGVRFFQSTDSKYAQKKERTEHFVTYRCRNCGHMFKKYAFWALLKDDETSGELYKFGEWPPFGPPTPARVVSLAGEEKDYYFKGRRAESQGLGIAAFAYYRRVVENQKDKIFDEIIRVSQRLGAQEELLQELNAAKMETQFAKAVGVVKHAIPQSLLINGHNPLSLLHSALSEGLHAQTDTECLELATSIRVVLTDFVERAASALRDEAELNAALTRLLKASGPRP